MSLLIKIQKARRMIENNGFLGGGKIVSGYLHTYLKSFLVGEGDILFITGGIGDKAHYRAFGVAEELRLHNFRCAVTVADNFQLEKLATRFKIFVFHKVIYDEKIKNLIEAIKKQHKEIIFDTDDLDFDSQYLSQIDYLSNISAAEKQEYARGIGAEILRDPYVNVATTTVNYLAQILRSKGKKVFVVANKISNHELALTEKISARPKTKDEYVRIGYYSGTLSHNKDFATVVPALVEILKKYLNVKLVLAGPLDTKNTLNKFKERIEVLPRVSRDEYYANVAKCDINLAPLEIDNPFCEAKSAIKFMEAGVLGIPTVAVRNQTFSEVITDGVDGLLAMTTVEWVTVLEKLIVDPKLRQVMGERARQKVLRDYTNRNSHSEEYYCYLKEALARLSA